MKKIVYEHSVKGLFVDLLEEIKTGQVSILEILGSAFTFIAFFYFLFGLPILFSLIKGVPVTNPGLIYEPLVNIFMYLK